MHFEGTFSNARNGALIEFLGTDATLYIDRGRYELMPGAEQEGRAATEIVSAKPDCRGAGLLRQAGRRAAAPDELGRVRPQPEGADRAGRRRGVGRRGGAPGQPGAADRADGGVEGLGESTPVVSCGHCSGRRGRSNSPSVRTNCTSAHRRSAMGAHAYWYVVKYNPDVEAALRELREREFAAGRYNPAMPFILFPITPASPAPGAAPRIRSRRRWRTPRKTALGRSWTSTGSRTSRTSERWPRSTTRRCWSTSARPPRPGRQSSKTTASSTTSSRGQGVYVVLYKDGVPDELFFAGYSYD